jgi:hypothetical protein
MNRRLPYHGGNERKGTPSIESSVTKARRHEQHGVAQYEDRGH